MTKEDWVHGVGRSSVCEIVLQIAVKAVMTPSPVVLALLQVAFLGKCDD